MEHASPLLAQYDEARLRVDAETKELASIEDQARQLRMRLQVSSRQLQDAQRALERALGTPVRTASEPPSQTRKKSKTSLKWKTGQPLPPAFQELLKAFPERGPIRFAELASLLPVVPQTVRNRLTRAKACGLVTPAGWGLYKLTSAARKALVVCG